MIVFTNENSVFPSFLLLSSYTLCLPFSSVVVVVSSFIYRMCVLGFLVFGAGLYLFFDVAG